MNKTRNSKKFQKYNPYKGRLKLPKCFYQHNSMNYSKIYNYSWYFSFESKKVLKRIKEMFFKKGGIYFVDGGITLFTGKIILFYLTIVCDITYHLKCTHISY